MVKIEQSLCIGCAKCVKDCVSGVLHIDQGKAAVRESCMQCGHCVAVCPVKAVSIPEYDMADVAEYDKDSFTYTPECFLNAVKFRRSIRSYKDRRVEREQLLGLIEAGRYTATAVNTQSVGYVIVQEKLEEFKAYAWKGWLSYADTLPSEQADLKAAIYKFHEAYQKDPRQDRLFFNAPVLLVIATENSWDGGLAAQNIEMMAVAEGLGVLYNGFMVRAVRQNPEAAEWLGLSGKNVCCCLLIGYPNVVYQRTAPRKTADVTWK
ncbi:MAG: nitroreductase family protein [[Clostridium] symbiosum]|nr:nitroreductase family protein [[Clostridium] symbiosum]